jgi:glucosyl-dolichyl phosphate glucuronosyltransferase
MKTQATRYFVSIVVCTHNLKDYPFLKEALKSLLGQTYSEKEITLVVDGNPELYKRILSDYQSEKRLRVILLNTTMGISEARNAGIRESKGDILAFIDDDAVAEKDWIEKLVAVYVKYDAIAVGGKILPDWIGGPVPDFFPEELYWLVGVTNRGFAQDTITEVRNAYGSNMSFKKIVFDEAGLFSHGFGFTGNACVQAEEPELSLRMRKKFSRGVIYNPEAIVHHKIPSSKVKLGTLYRRSFYQGYSKALIKKIDSVKDPLNTERSYLRYLLIESIPGRLKRFYHFSELKKVLVLIISIIGVGLGFIFGSVQKNIIKKQSG